MNEVTDKLKNGMNGMTLRLTVIIIIIIIMIIIEVTATYIVQPEGVGEIIGIERVLLLH